MKGIDTNVLARYLLNDDPEQAREAERFLVRECSANDPGIVNRIVLCELVWVLERGYKLPRAQVVDLLERLFEVRQLVIEDFDDALVALRNYRKGGGFADAFLGEVNQRLGCDYTATFDRKAAGGKLFRQL